MREQRRDCDEQLRGVLPPRARRERRTPQSSTCCAVFYDAAARGVRGST